MQNKLNFVLADATDRKSILELKRNRAFTKAVSNMAIMDITDIEPLLMAVYELLQESGIFVFATQHPCFVTLTEKYMTPHSYYDIAIERGNRKSRFIIIVPYKIFLTFVLELDLSLMDFMKNVLKPTKKFLW